MRKMNIRSGALLLAALVAVGTAWAEIPGNLKGLVYRGRLTPAGREQAMAMTFRLYDAPTNGACHWARTYSVLVAADGSFEQVLGDEKGIGQSADGVKTDLTTAIAECVQATGDSWMELAVARAESTPIPFDARQKLQPVPEAFMAAKALNCDIAVAPSLVCGSSLTVTGKVSTVVLRDCLTYTHPLSAKVCSSNGVATLSIRPPTTLHVGEAYINRASITPSSKKSFEILSPTVRYVEVGKSYRSVIEMPSASGAVHVVPTTYAQNCITNVIVYDQKADFDSIGGENKLITKE